MPSNPAPWYISPHMLPLSEWHTLLAVQAGAAATLTGLVFVAISINLARIIETPGLSGRAGDSILQFLQVCLSMHGNAHSHTARGGDWL